MAEVKHARHQNDNDLFVERAREFWARNGRIVLIVLGVIIVLGGGWLAYKYLVKEPKEQKAAEAVWKAEQYFAEDSVKQALAGDRQFAGFEKVIREYSSTKTGNLSRFYAGVLALKSGDNNKAVNYLKDFSTDSKPVQARAYKLLGDAYAGVGKNKEALSNYKKAAKEFPDDRQGSAEYLYFAAYFADRGMNDKKEAIELYKELVNKYPNSQFSSEAEKYLAAAGVYKTE